MQWRNICPSNNIQTRCGRRLCNCVRMNLSLRHQEGTCKVGRVTGAETCSFFLLYQTNKKNTKWPSPCFLPSLNCSVWNTAPSTVASLMGECEWKISHMTDMWKRNVVFTFGKNSNNLVYICNKFGMATMGKFGNYVTDNYIMF